MALPPPLLGLTCTPRPQLAISEGHYPNGRTLSQRGWLDIKADAVLTRAQWAALPAALAVWDTNHWLSAEGVTGGWRYRLAKIGQATPFGQDNVRVNLDIEAQATSPASANAITTWPLPCPLRDGFSATPLPVLTQQQFSSGHTRQLRRRLGRLDQLNFALELDTTQFGSLLGWYCSLLRAGMPAVQAPWLGNLSAKTHIKLIKPWQATRIRGGWTVSMEAITCDSNI